MINKNFLVGIALAGVLLFAPSADAQVAVQDPNVEELDVFYAKAGYSPSMLQKVTWDGVYDKSTTANSEVLFKPKYDFGFMGGAAAIGYYFGGVRVELEGSMNNVTPTGTSELSSAKNDGKSAVYKGASYIGAVLSVNYDIAVTDYVSPYFGVGCGFQRVALDFTNGTPLAYHLASQVKAGVNVTGLASVVPYAGYKFTYLAQKEYSSAKSDDNSTNFTPKVSHMMHNFEFGVMVPVNA